MVKLKALNHGIYDFYFSLLKAFMCLSRSADLEKKKSAILHSDCWTRDQHAPTAPVQL